VSTVSQGTCAAEPEEFQPTTVIRSKPLSAETMAEFTLQQQQQQ